MTIYEVLDLAINFGLFVIGLLGLIFVIVKDAKK
jgi:hypothetical protein